MTDPHCVTSNNGSMLPLKEGWLAINCDVPSLGHLLEDGFHVFLRQRHSFTSTTNFHADMSLRDLSPDIIALMVPFLNQTFRCHVVYRQMSCHFRSVKFGVVAFENNIKQRRIVVPNVPLFRLTTHCSPSTHIHRFSACDLAIDYSWLQYERQ